MLEGISICLTEEYETNLSGCRTMELDIGLPLEGEPGCWSQSCVALL
jgi:hypothetical protein